MLIRAPIVVCSAPNQGKKNLAAGASLQVIHRLRLSEGRGGVDRATMMSELVRQPARLRSSRRSKVNGVYLPAKDESRHVLGTHSAVVGLGSTKTQLSLVIDTGSDIMWTQCKPCEYGCYPQRDQIFDPATSSTYSEVLCHTTTCDEALLEATGNKGACFRSSSILSDKAQNKCNYVQFYTEDTNSAGIMARDSLTLSRGLILPGIIFGCGQQNNLTQRDNAGVMGLGKGSLSIVSQMWDTFGKIFSYCLATEKGTAPGHLTFGTGASPYRGSIKYTKLVTKEDDPNSYYVTVLGVSVNGEEKINTNNRSPSAGTLFFVDSGNAISTLPLGAYQALNNSFTRHMEGYRRVKVEEGMLLDNCYDLRGVGNPKIPEMSFTFGGGVVVELDPASVMVDITKNADHSTVCLAFAPAPGGVGMFGSYQHQTLEMVYDVAGGRLGFGQNGCT